MIHRIKMLKECPYWLYLFWLQFGACSRIEFQLHRDSGREVRNTDCGPTAHVGKVEHVSVMVLADYQLTMNVHFPSPPQ